MTAYLASAALGAVVFMAPVGLAFVLAETYLRARRAHHRGLARLHRTEHQ